MAPIEQFVIVLDDGRTLFHPGDEVRGRVLLKLNGSMTVTKVRVGFHGEGYVRHKSGKTNYHMTQPIFHYGCTVYDSFNEPSRGNLHPGEYWFPFVFRLPPIHLPTTYHDSTSHVKYWLDASVVRQFWPNKKTSVAIFVMEPVNVNSPELQQPQTKQQEMTICCCCVRGGKVNVTGKINRGGYYPGEVIESKFLVENQSNREVTYTELVLIQRLKKQFTADKDDTRTTITTVASARNVGVPPREEADITNLRLTIPTSLPPSTVADSSIVHVSYEIELIAHTKGACVCAAKVEFPVIIGFMSSRPSDWSRQVLQAIGQLVNAQLEQEAQEARQEQQMGNDNRITDDDQAMLVV